MTACVNAWKLNGEDADKLRVMQDIVASIPDLVNGFNSLLNPPEVEEPDWIVENQREAEQWTIEHQRQMNEWRDFRDRLVADPDSIQTTASTEHFNGLTQWIYKSRFLRRECQNHHFSFFDWDLLARAFSPDVADAAAKMFARYWRSHPINDAYVTRRGHPTSLEKAALIGLAVDGQQTPEFQNSCSDEDVVRATHLALYELNCFPDWAPLLWSIHPYIVEPILRKEIHWEFNQNPENGITCHVIQRFAQTGEPFRSMVADWIQKELERSSPNCINTLSQSLKVITDSKSGFKERLSKLASKRFFEDCEDHKMLWLSIWIGTEADKALDALGQWIESQNSQSEQQALVIMLLNNMFKLGFYRYGEHYSDFDNLDSLAQFLRIVFTHIRMDEDVEHEGVYSVEERENAEQARSNLYRRLLDTPGERAYKEAIALSKISGLGIPEDRFRALAEVRAAQDADLAPMSPAEVLEFSKQHEELTVMNRVSARKLRL